MARIALVQSYPYEAVSGGDAVYIVALRNYLISCGHDVFNMVTDTMRGRMLPYYVNAYDLGDPKSWKVRYSFRLGKCFISYKLINWLLLGVKIISKRNTHRVDNFWIEKEAFWVNKELSRHHIDVAILFFEATGFSSFLTSKARIISVLGFLDDNIGILDNGGSNPSSRVKLDERVLRLNYESCIAMNNMSDLIIMKDYGFRNVILVRSGFPFTPTDAWPMNDTAPIVLMVAAHTSSNVASCCWLLDEVWPIVLGGRPDARLRLVGRIASLVESRPCDGVEGVGHVPELAAEYARAHVVVAPLVLGSRGVKIKVAEALSHGCALVTTSLGIDAGDPEQFSGAVDVADTAEDFAAAVLALLNDAPLRAKRKAQSAKAFERNFSYEAAYGDLVRHLEL